MDKVIYLEPDEEITTVIDKLKRSKSPIVGIVAPRGAILLQSIVNLKLLKKEAERVKKEIALVTSDPVGQNLALRTGLTVYANVHDTEPLEGGKMPRPDDVIDAGEISKPDTGGFQVHHYRGEPTQESPKEVFQSHPVAETPPPKPDVPPPIFEKKDMAPPSPLPAETPPPPANITKKTLSSPLKPSETFLSKHRTLMRRLIVIGVILAILIISGVFVIASYFPKATINLTLASEQFDESIDVTVDKNITVADEANQKIPGRMIDSSQEGAKKFKATGKKDIGEKATGTMKIYNETGVDRSFEAGTSLQAASSSLVFKSDKAFTVPKATATVDPSGRPVVNKGSVSVNVTADEPGEKYNLAATTYAISGYTKVYGEGSAMTGGSTKQVTILQQSDIDKAKSEYSASLYEEAADDLKNKAGGAILLSKGIKNAITEAKSNIDVGEEATDFELNLKTKSTVMIFDQEPFTKLVSTLMAAKTPEGKELIIKGIDEYNMKVNSTDYVKGFMELNVTTDAPLVVKIDQAALKKQVLGKSKAEALSFISQNYEVESVDINVTSSWRANRLPKLENRIVIKVNYQPLAEPSPTLAPTLTPTPTPS